MSKVLLDVTLLNPLLVQIFDKLLSLHPVDKWTDVSAVSKEGSTRQVDRTSCGRQETGYEVRQLLNYYTVHFSFMQHLQNHSSLSKSDLAHTSCVQNIHFCSCPHDHARIRINIQYCCIPKHQCMSTLRKNSNFITFCSLACLDYSCLYQLCYRCS